MTERFQALVDKIVSSPTALGVVFLVTGCMAVLTLLLPSASSPATTVPSTGSFIKTGSIVTDSGTALSTQSGVLAPSQTTQSGQSVSESDAQVLSASGSDAVLRLAAAPALGVSTGKPTRNVPPKPEEQPVSTSVLTQKQKSSGKQAGKAVVVENVQSVMREEITSAQKQQKQTVIFPTQTFGTINVLLSQDGTAVRFQKDARVYTIKQLLDVSMQFDSKYFEVGKKNTIHVEIKDDLAFIGPDVQLQYKPSKWKDEVLTADCSSGRCDIPVTFTEQETLEWEITLKNTISTWSANMKVDVGVGAMTFQLFDRNQNSAQNNRFQVVPVWQFKAPESESWSVTWNGAPLEYVFAKKMFVQKNTQTPIVLCVSETTASDASPVFEFLQEGEYSIQYSLFPSMALFWTQSPPFHIEPVALSGSSFLGIVDGKGDARRFEGTDRAYTLKQSLGLVAPGLQYFIDFGDGSEPVQGNGSLSGIVLEHTYKSSGFFTQTIRVLSVSDIVTQLFQSVTLGQSGEPLPVIRYKQSGDAQWNILSLTGASFLPNRQYEFDASLSETSAKSSFLWYFGETKKSFESKQVSYGFRPLAREENAYLYLSVKDNETGKRNVLRIPYTLEQKAPFVCYEVSTDAGESPVLVEFSARCSYDPNGSAIRAYRIDFGDGLSESVQVLQTAQFRHSYYYQTEYDPTPNDDDATALYRPVLEVQDAAGEWHRSFDTVEIRVKQAPGVPKIQFEMPLNSRFFPQEEVRLTAFATDPEEGLLQSRFVWEILGDDPQEKYYILCRGKPQCALTIPTQPWGTRSKQWSVRVSVTDSDGHQSISAQIPFSVIWK